MELEHLTVLLSFLLFPCVIFGLGLALLFLRRSFLLITHFVMIISLPCNISFIPGQTQQARRTRSNRSWRRRTWEPPTSCFSPSLRFSSPFSFSILLFFSWCNLDVHIMWRSWIIPKIVTWRLLDALFYYHEGSKTRQIYVSMEMSHFVCNNWFVPRIGKNALMDKLGAPHVKLQIIWSKLKNKMFDLCLSLCPWSLNSALRLVRMDTQIVNKFWSNFHVVESQPIDATKYIILYFD